LIIPSQFPDTGFHTLISQSFPPDTIKVPLGEKARVLTKSVCPSSFITRPPVCTSHSWIEYLDEEARKDPSGENMIHVTSSAWLLRVISHTPVTASKTCTISSIALAINLPFGENVTLFGDPDT
jgi:hypothetical protein